MRPHRHLGRQIGLAHALILAVAGASLVTRLFARRSIYTVRIASSGPGSRQSAVGTVSTQPAQ